MRTPLAQRNAFQRQHAAMLVLPMMLAASSGCELIRGAAAYSAPQTKKIAPEFNRLPDKQVLIHVWVPPEIKWDYPYVRLDVAACLGAYLKENVEDVTIIDPRRVELYLEKRGAGQVDPTDLGRRFHADTVIHLSVHHFSLRDPGMAQFYRGRLKSAVTVYELPTDSEATERFSLENVEVAYPDEDSLGFVDVQPAQVMRATYETFANKVGRKFHTWEKQLE
jgi:hypothetical protein